MTQPQPHPVDLHVGRRLRQLRRQRGLTQARLAERLDLTFQQIQKYERGANRISASKLFDAAQVLEVAVAELFDGLDVIAAHPVPDPLRALALLPEGDALAQAFSRIGEAELRRALVRIVERLAAP